MTLLDPVLLQSFVSTAKAGSISKAAVLLGRTQPAVSQQLRRLEDTAGRALLSRTTRGIALTSAGEAFLPYAERLLTLALEAHAALTGASDPMKGRCGIGLLVDLVDAALPAMLTDVQRIHPEVELEVLVSSGTAMRDAFDNGQVQLLVGDPGYMEPHVPHWQRTVQPLWVAALGARVADPLQLVLFSQPCRWRQPLLEQLNQAGRRWRIVFESSDLSAIHTAIRNGVGIAPLLPGTLPRGTEALHDQLPPPPEVDIALYLQSSTRRNPLVLTMAEILLRHMPLTP